jgi:hypothetical protein
MNRPRYSVHIDRLILNDLDVALGEAEHIRNQLAGRLQRLLDLGEGSGALSIGDTSRLSAPMIHLAMPHSNSRMVGSLARSLAQALHGADRGKGVEQDG